MEKAARMQVSINAWTRRVTLVILLLSAVCWVIYIVAFAWLRNNFADGEDSNGAYKLRFPYLAFAVGAPVLYIKAFLNIVLGWWKIGVGNNFCAAFILIAAGGVLYGDGLIVSNQIDHIYMDAEIRSFITAEFTGCLLATLFVVMYMMCQNSLMSTMYMGCVERGTPASASTVKHPTTSTPAAVAVQAGAPMRPVIFPMKKAYPEGVVYPVSNVTPKTTSTPKNATSSTAN